MGVAKSQSQAEPHSSTNGNQNPCEENTNKHGESENSCRENENPREKVFQASPSNWQEPVELHQKLGLELLEAKNGNARARLPVAGNTQISGVLHGGANALLIEATAGYAAMSVICQESAPQQVAVGTEVSLSHVRSAREGFVEAEAIPVHLGKTRMVHRVEVRRSQDSKLVSTGTVTHAIILVQN